MSKKVLKVVVYDAAAHEHRPLASGAETIEPLAIPLSSFPGNRMATNADGLYVGENTMSPLLYIDGDTGVDGSLPTDGSPTTLKTLDYALSLIETFKPGQVTLLFKAGQTFELESSHTLEDVKVTLSYFGDPKYGLYNERFGTSKIAPQLQLDLTRPLITTTEFFSSGGLWTCPHIRLRNSEIHAHGLRFNTPVSPSGTTNIQLTQYSAESDLLLSEDSVVNLNGCIVNKVDRANFSGFLGVVSRKRTTLTQYASQFRIENELLVDSITTPSLLVARNYFIKFCPDLPTDDQFTTPYPLVASSVTATDAVGLLTLMWLLCSSTEDPVSGSASLRSFPVADYTHGIMNYIYGIRRDAQHRALNVATSLLL